MTFDYDIIKTFIPEKDKYHFLAFENIYLSSDGKSIYAPYRAPFSNKLIIEMTDYLAKLRDAKIDLLISN